MEISNPLILLSAADQRVAPLTSINRQRDNAYRPDLARTLNNLASLYRDIATQQLQGPRRWPLGGKRYASPGARSALSSPA